MGRRPTAAAQAGQTKKICQTREAKGLLHKLWQSRNGQSLGLLCSRAPRGYAVAAEFTKNPLNISPMGYIHCARIALIC